MHTLRPNGDNKKMNKIKIMLIAFSIFLLSGCADSVSFSQAQVIDPVGFWHGLWHGIIILFSFVFSIFSDDIAIYAIYNNGGWYDLGFFIGVFFFPFTIKIKF